MFDLVLDHRHQFFDPLVIFGDPIAEPCVEETFDLAATDNPNTHGRNGSVVADPFNTRGHSTIPRIDRDKTAARVHQHVTKISQFHLLYSGARDLTLSFCQPGLGLHHLHDREKVILARQIKVGKGCPFRGAILVVEMYGSLIVLCGPHHAAHHSPDARGPHEKRHSGFEVLPRLIHLCLQCQIRGAIPYSNCRWYPTRLSWRRQVFDFRPQYQHMFDQK